MRRLLLLSAVAAGCTLLTPFDPEGQPCDASAPPALRCLVDAGFVCMPSELFDAGVCVRSTDAGRPPSGVDAGQGPRDAGCDAGRPDGGC